MKTDLFTSVIILLVGILLLALDITVLVLLVLQTGGLGAAFGALLLDGDAFSGFIIFGLLGGLFTVSGGIGVLQEIAPPIVDAFGRFFDWIGDGIKSIFQRRPAPQPEVQRHVHVEFARRVQERVPMRAPIEQPRQARMERNGEMSIYEELLRFDMLNRIPVTEEERHIRRTMAPRGNPYDFMPDHPYHFLMGARRHEFELPVALRMQARAPRPAAEIEDKTMKAIASDIEDARARGESEVDLTERLQGPISYERMVDPVLAEDGFTYERNQIEGWLAQSNQSPMTREVMGRNLHANAEMKALLNRFEGQEEAKLEVAQAGAVLGA